MFVMGRLVSPDAVHGSVIDLPYYGRGYLVACVKASGRTWQACDNVSRMAARICEMLHVVLVLVHESGCRVNMKRHGINLVVL